MTDQIKKQLVEDYERFSGNKLKITMVDGHKYLDVDFVNFITSYLEHIYKMGKMMIAEFEDWRKVRHMAQDIIDDRDKNEVDQC